MGSCYGWLLWVDADWCLQSDAVSDALHVDITSAGIRVTFIQSGKFYEFSFSVLLTTLVTSLALLAISSTLVNLLMTQVLPMKALYKDHKYDVTEDFSVWRENKKHFETEKKLAILRNTGKLADTGVDYSKYTSDHDGTNIEVISGSAVSAPVSGSPDNVYSSAAIDRIEIVSAPRAPSHAQTLGVTQV